MLNKVTFNSWNACLKKNKVWNGGAIYINNTTENLQSSEVHLQRTMMVVPYWLTILSCSFLTAISQKTLTKMAVQ